MLNSSYLLNYVRTGKFLFQLPFKPLAFNELFKVLNPGLNSFDIYWNYEWPRYLVSFGPLNLIPGTSYYDALWDRF